MENRAQYRGRTLVESGRFPVTFKNGQYQVWSGRSMAGQAPTYNEAIARRNELEDRWVAELKASIGQ